MREKKEDLQLPNSILQGKKIAEANEHQQIREHASTHPLTKKILDEFNGTITNIEVK